jgi:hypothetical protein
MRLNEGAILEVSAPEGATEKQVRRRGRGSLVLGTIIAALAFAAVAYADQVQADSDVVAANVQNSPITVNLAPSGTTSVTAGVQIKSQGSTHVAFDVSIAPSTENVVGNTVGPPADSSLTVSAYGDAGEKTTSFLVTAPAAADLVCGQNNLFQAKLHFTATTDLTAFGSGGNDTDFVIVNVNVAGPVCTPPNTPPDVDAGGPYSSVVEGSGRALNATVTDDGTPSLSWSASEDPAYNDVDDGASCSFSDSAVEDPTVTCNDDGHWLLTLTADDGVNDPVSDSEPLLVTNANPAFESGKPAFANAKVNCAANTVTLSFAFSDAGSNDTHTSTISWGDGSATENLDATATAAESASHTFNSGGPYTATVNVTDDDNGSTGNMSSTNTLIVEYNMSDLLQPINNTGHGESPSVFKYGSTIPVKVEVTDCDGLHPSNLDLRVTYTVTSSTTPPGETEAASTSAADSGNRMRFSDPIYIFNLASRNVTTDSSSSVRLLVSLMNGSTVLQSANAQIGFKK